MYTLNKPSSEFTISDIEIVNIPHNYQLEENYKLIVDQLYNYINNMRNYMDINRLYVNLIRKRTSKDLDTIIIHSGIVLDNNTFSNLNLHILDTTRKDINKKLRKYITTNWKLLFSNIQEYNDNNNLPLIKVNIIYPNTTSNNSNNKENVESIEISDEQGRQEKVNKSNKCCNNKEDVNQCNSKKNNKCCNNKEDVNQCNNVNSSLNSDNIFTSYTSYTYKNSTDNCDDDYDEEDIEIEDEVDIEELYEDIIYKLDNLEKNIIESIKETIEKSKNI